MTEAPGEHAERFVAPHRAHGARPLDTTVLNLFAVIGVVLLFMGVATLAATPSMW